MTEQDNESEPEREATDEEIEADRQERLAEENRPDGALVDNTDRDFDPEKGMFTDSDGYEQAEEKFAAEGEQGA
jgi:hypothetical protein